jgi:hypothetical protein
MYLLTFDSSHFVYSTRHEIRTALRHEQRSHDRFCCIQHSAELLTISYCYMSFVKRSARIWTLLWSVKTYHNTYVLVHRHGACYTIYVTNFISWSFIPKSSVPVSTGKRSTAVRVSQWIAVIDTFTAGLLRFPRSSKQQKYLNFVPYFQYNWSITFL